MNAVRLEKMPARIPTDGTFELTLRCNLKCRMCLFRHDDSDFPAMKAEELSAAEWIDMARQAAEAGTIGLLITGGEPMLRPDFCEIWEGIYRLGFIIQLYTNATLINDKIMDTLRRCPPHKIGITLYGASAETYEKVCGNGAMYERALTGIRRLMTLPSVLEFRATIIKDNYSDAEAIENLVSREFGYPGNLITARIVNKGVRGACGKAEECRLEPEDNIKLMYLRARMRMKEYLGTAYDENALHLVEADMSDSDEECREAGELSLLGCKGGMSRYVITYDGKLQGCQMLGAFQTDARTAGFRDAWEAYPGTVKIPPMNPKCADCKNMKYCSICPAAVYAETGTLDGWPEYICRDTEAHLKMFARKQEETYEKYDL